MRIYTSLTEARREIERDLWEMGTVVQSYSVQDKVVSDDPGYAMMEVTGYGYKVTSASDIELFIEKQGLSREWIVSEFNERTSGVASNPGDAWRKRYDVWKPFIHEGKFSYTYPERLAQNSQLECIVNELRRHPSSRQAIASIYRPEDILRMGGIQRIPCSIFYQFMVRRGAVDLHYIQRSCDFMVHFNYDLVLAVMMLDWMSRRLKVRPGIFHHYITSLHAFRKDFPAGVF